MTGGASTNQGVDFQAEFGATLAVHLLAGTEIPDFRSAALGLVPKSIGFETGGPGDDLVARYDSCSIEVQAKSGKVKWGSADFRDCLGKLLTGLHKNPDMHGFMVITPDASESVRAVARDLDGIRKPTTHPATSGFRRLKDRVAELKVPEACLSRLHFICVQRADTYRRQGLSQLLAQRGIPPEACESALSVIYEGCVKAGSARIQTWTPKEVERVLKEAGLEVQAQTATNVRERLKDGLWTQADRLSVAGAPGVRVERLRIKGRRSVKKRGKQSDSSETPTILEALSDDARLMVVARRGSGKSFEARLTAMDELSADRLCAIVRASDVAAAHAGGSSDPILQAAIGTQGLDAAAVSKLTATESGTVILDALDEAGATSQTAIRAVETWLGTRPAWKAVLIGRPAFLASEELPGWPIFDLSEPSEAEQAQTKGVLVNAVASHFGKDPAAVEQPTDRALASLKTLAIKTDPLVVGIIASLCAQGKAVPKTRRGVVEAALNHYFAGRGTGTVPNSTAHAEVLQAWSWATLGPEASCESSYDYVIRHLQDKQGYRPGQAVQSIDEAFRFALQQGLILEADSVEPWNGPTFGHHVFVECMAAQHARRLEPGEFNDWVSSLAKTAVGADTLRLLVSTPQATIATLALIRTGFKAGYSVALELATEMADKGLPAAESELLARAVLGAMASDFTAETHKILGFARPWVERRPNVTPAQLRSLILDQRCWVSIAARALAISLPETLDDALKDLSPKIRECLELGDTEGGVFLGYATRIAFAFIEAASSAVPVQSRPDAARKVLQAYRDTGKRAGEVSMDTFAALEALASQHGLEELLPPDYKGLSQFPRIDPRLFDNFASQILGGSLARLVPTAQVGTAHERDSFEAFFSALFAHTPIAELRRVAGAEKHQEPGIDVVVRLKAEAWGMDIRKLASGCKAPPAVRYPDPSSGRLLKSAKRRKVKVSDSDLDGLLAALQEGPDSIRRAAADVLDNNWGDVANRGLPQLLHVIASNQDSGCVRLASLVVVLHAGKTHLNAVSARVQKGPYPGSAGAIEAAKLLYDNGIDDAWAVIEQGLASSDFEAGSIAADSWAKTDDERSAKAIDTALDAMRIWLGKEAPCPYCRKSRPSETDSCPHCSRVYESPTRRVLAKAVSMGAVDWQGARRIQEALEKVTRCRESLATTEAANRGYGTEILADLKRGSIGSNHFADLVKAEPQVIHGLADQIREYAPSANSDVQVALLESLMSPLLWGEAAIQEVLKESLASRNPIVRNFAWQVSGHLAGQLERPSTWGIRTVERI